MFAQETVRSVDIEQRKQKANKPCMMKLLPSASLTLESPLLGIDLRREIVASAAEYLGLVPILQYANVFFPSYTGTDACKSQLFRRDSDEIEQVKMFVLCDEVTPASGSLTCLPAAPSETLRSKAAFKYNNRLADIRCASCSVRRQRRRPSLAPPEPPHSSTQVGAFTSAADVPTPVRTA